MCVCACVSLSACVHEDMLVLCAMPTCTPTVLQIARTGRHIWLFVESCVCLQERFVLLEVLDMFR